MSQVDRAGNTGEELREAAQNGSVQRPPRSALRRFFLLEDELAEARALRFGSSQPGYAEYERAKEAEESIAAIMTPREALQSSDGTRAALTLAREAALWALKAHLLQSGQLGESRDVWNRFLALPLASQVESALGREAFSQARLLVVQEPPELSAPADTVHDKAELALVRELVSRLLAPLDEATRTADLVRIRRVVRIGMTIAVMVALTIASVVFVRGWLRGPNLALNRATSSSSAYGNQRTTSGVVDGIKTVHGFHTDEETNPWLSIDLGSPKKIGSVIVYNRTDCCSDRAAPLVIEASIDGAMWKQVARREKKFSTWEATFPATEARFVRLTAQKKTWLHFNEVEIYGE